MVEAQPPFNISTGVDGSPAESGQPESAAATAYEAASPDSGGTAGSESFEPETSPYCEQPHGSGLSGEAHEAPQPTAVHQKTVNPGNIGTQVSSVGDTTVNQSGTHAG